MIKNILVIILVFVSGVSFAQDDAAKSLWATTPIKVDGNPQEWKLPLKFYDPGAKLFYAFANDYKNLYICFQANDDMNQTKIMKAGMKITLSTKERKDKHKVSINYPIEQKTESSQLKNDNSDEQLFDQKSKRINFLAQNTMMEVKGFTTRDGLIPINDTSGINAAINWDDKNKLTYEIAIPLKEIFGANYAAEDISKNITLDAEVNAIARPSHPGTVGGSDFSGKDGGKVGGYSGGSHLKDANGQEINSDFSSADRATMFEKGKLRQKFVLAQSDDSK